MPGLFDDLIPSEPVTAGKLTFYYPATPEDTRKAGLNPKVEGGTQGGGRFGHIDLRNHTLEKYNPDDPESVVAVAMPGDPTGKRFPLNVNGKTVRAWNIDTGGGLTAGQIDVATSNPRLAKSPPIRGNQPKFDDLIPSRNGTSKSAVPQQQVKAGAFADLIPKPMPEGAEIRRAEPLPMSQQPGGKLPVEIGDKEKATLQHPDEQDYTLSVNREPLIPSEVIKAGYKTSPLYWLGKWASPQKTEAIAEGIARTAAGFTTPENAALLAVTPFLPGGTIGKLAGTAMASYFEAQAIHQFPAEWKEFKETSDPVKKWQIGSQMAVGLGLPLTALIAVGGMTHPDELTPAQAKNLNEALEPLVAQPKPASVTATETGERGVAADLVGNNKLYRAAALKYSTGDIVEAPTHAQALDQSTIPTEAGFVSGFVTHEGKFVPYVGEIGKGVRATEQFKLAAPETDEQMLSRQAHEDAVNKALQLESEKQAQVKYGWQQKLPGTTGSLGQADLFGGEDLFARPSTTEQLQMQREYEEELLSEAEQHLSRGGDELKDALRKFGGLPLPDSPHAEPLKGELNALREEFKTRAPGGRGRKFFGKSESGQYAYDDVFSKNAGSTDRLAQNLKQAGFDVETGDDVIELVRNQLRSDKPLYGNEARGEALEAASYSSQDLYGMGLRRGQPDVGLKIIRGIQKAVDVIQSGLFGKSPSFDAPKLNLENGGKTPPPPNSIYSPDTPPDGVPEYVYAMRVTNSFKRWWEKFWPRDLSVHDLRNKLKGMGADASPVISAHQRFIAAPVDFMENFSKQPFWKAVRGRSDEELIDLEDKAVKQFRAQYQLELSMKGPQADRLAAKQKVLSQFPEWFQNVLLDDQRIAQESADYRELGLDPPIYTGDPYLARITNEDGKDIVDLNPGISTTVGRALKASIGAFDNSRVHATMKDGIKVGTQYEPVARSVFIRELTSSRLHSTANLLRELKGKVLFDRAEDALAASPNRRISAVRGLGPKTYYARTPEEAVFLEQNVSTIAKHPWGKLMKLSTTYLRDWNLVNPLPHITKNMFVKYALARVNNTQFKSDVAEYARSKPSELKQRFDKVMPFPSTASRIPEIMAREVGTWGERAMQQSSKPNSPSRNYIFQKADPAMRFSLWKDYVRKGLSDQDAANHVWIDLIRYDANSGGMNFWKSIPMNFFVPWRTGTYVTMAKAFKTHPIRTMLYFGALDYLRETRYRQTGRWTHLPHDYFEAPLGEMILASTRVHDVRSGRQAVQSTLATAATTLLFGPGGGQAPNTIKDVMAGLSGDPSQKARIMNMFWGLSQLYNLPSEWRAFQQDQNPKHLVNILTTIAVSEHSALKYEPRRLMKWLPEWMPGMQKSELVKQSEALQEIIRRRQEKAGATYEERHGVSRTFQYTPEEQQIQELRRGAGQREGTTSPFSKPRKPRREKTSIPLYQ